jgi:hypothetical protein
MSHARHDPTTRNGRTDSDAIEWKDYPRIVPGEYSAYCKWGKQYRDPGFRRWLCLLRWDVLSEDLVRVIACVPQWFPLGSRDKPRASRRGKYLPEWIRANGGPPARRDRLSPGVFVHRMARVEIGDTEGPAPYSVVRRIVDWETGPPGHSVSKSTSQGRPPVSGVESDGFATCLSGLSEEGMRDGVNGKPKRFSLLAPGEDSALHERDTNAESVRASALAGVEGESTPAHTQGAGASATANPPKAHQTLEQRPRREGFDIRGVSANNCSLEVSEDA